MVGRGRVGGRGRLDGRRRDGLQYAAAAGLPPRSEGWVTVRVTVARPHGGSYTMVLTQNRRVTVRVTAV